MKKRKKELKQYRVSMTAEYRGYMYVEAESEEEAISKAEKLDGEILNEECINWDVLGATIDE